MTHIYLVIRLAGAIIGTVSFPGDAYNMATCEEMAGIARDTLPDLYLPPDEATASCEALTAAPQIAEAGR